MAAIAAATRISGQRRISIRFRLPRRGLFRRWIPWGIFRSRIRAPRFRIRFHEPPSLRRRIPRGIPLSLLHHTILRLFRSRIRAPCVRIRFHEPRSHLRPRLLLLFHVATGISASHCRCRETPRRRHTPPRVIHPKVLRHRS